MFLRSFEVTSRHRHPGHKNGASMFDVLAPWHQSRHPPRKAVSTPWRAHGPGKTPSEGTFLRSVAVNYLSRPRKCVLRADARWLRPDPKLKVFRPVVVLDSIDVVNVLAFYKSPANLGLHHKDVLEDVLARLLNEHHAVALFVVGRTTTPPRIPWAGLLHAKALDASTATLPDHLAATWAG